MKNKITKGEWEIEYDGSLCFGGQIIAQPEHLKPDYAPLEEGKANARLMSAAPDMLAVCQAVVAFFSGGIGVPLDPNHPYNLARAAIAKVNGKK